MHCTGVDSGRSHTVTPVAGVRPCTTASELAATTTPPPATTCSTGAANCAVHRDNPSTGSIDVRDGEPPGGSELRSSIGQSTTTDDPPTGGSVSVAPLPHTLSTPTHRARTPATVDLARRSRSVPPAALPVDPSPVDPSPVSSPAAPSVRIRSRSCAARRSGSLNSANACWSARKVAGSPPTSGWAVLTTRRHAARSCVIVAAGVIPNTW